MSTRADRRTRWALWLIWFVCALALGTFLYFWATGVSDRLSDSEAQTRESREVGRQALQGLERVNKQLEAAGEVPAVTPDDISKDPEVLPPSPQETDIVIEQEALDAAVERYCSNGRCTPIVTPRQVAAAVAANCDNDGSCRGPRGTVGPQGAAGQPGAEGQAGESGQPGAVGAVGPPPSDAQVLLGVETYCASGACQGEKGEKGERGEPGQQGEPGEVGPAGVGITSLSCDSLIPLTIEVAYSDGTTQTVTCGGP